MGEDPNVSIARLEAVLQGIKTQIDQQDRNQQQLVRLFDERVSARFDSVDQRLTAMDRAREESRNETARLREVTEERLKELEAKALGEVKSAAQMLHERDEEIERNIKAEAKRIDTLEKFNARLIGVAVGSSALTGGIFAGIMKAMGG